MIRGTNSKSILYGIIVIGLVLVAVSFFLWDNHSEIETNTTYRVLQADSTNYTVPARPDLGGYLIKVVLITIFILILIIGIARWYGKFSHFSGGPSRITVLAKHHIGPKQWLLLVKTEGKKLFLGATENTINLLMDLGEADDSEEDKYEPVSEPPSFASFLKQFRKGKNE